MTALRATRTAAALALAATLLTSAQGAARAEGAPAAVAPLDVLSYNTFLMSTSLYPNWGQAQRARAIADADFFQGHDVVVLQEAFDNAASDALAARAAAYPYRTPVVGRSTSGWDATSGGYSALTPEDGGVLLLSRWPILRKEQYVFEDACGSDRWSNKGFVYARIDVAGQLTHVVGTHLQSTDSGCASGQAADVRAEQLRAVRAFLDAERIPADEPVVLAGDLNIDSHGGEYPALLANGGLAPATARTGWANS